jgi:CRISPR type I-E-associated protein CasB/Cse2
MKEAYELIAALERLRDSNDRARLSSLRRGLGQPPGAVLEASRVVEHLLDEDDPPWTEDTLYIIGSLFAFHPLPYTGDRWHNMGDHFRALYPEGEDPPPNVERRFLASLSSEPDDLPDMLRQAISLLKSKSVPVNWLQLFEDVRQWLDRRSEGADKRQEIRLRWSRRFWRLPSRKTSSDSQNQN